MFESGYLVPLVAERLVPVSGNHSLIGHVLSGCLHNNFDSSAWMSFEAPRILNLFIVLCILLLAISAIIIGPFIQTLISFSKCDRRKTGTLRPKRCRITAFLLSFISCWLLLIVALIFLAIFFSEHLNFSSTQGDGFVERVDEISHRTFTLLRSLVNESKLITNDTIYGTMNDLYADLLLEIPTITTNFLTQTNLKNSLSILSDLASTVEALLDAHTFLRENGPKVALELEKLDSSIRGNVEMLIREIQETRRECREFDDQFPSLKAFSDSINELVEGLHKEELHGDTFFKLFHLESSLGLFNMLNVFPFNVSEVTNQLKSVVKVQDDLDASIQENMEYRFTQMMKNVAGMVDTLAEYINKGQGLINQTERTYNRKIREVNGTLDSLKHAWIFAYFVEMMVATAPLVLLFSSCMCHRHKVTVPIKEIFPLLTIDEVVSASSSGCGSSEDETSTLTAPGKQVPAAIHPIDRNFIGTRELFSEPGPESSISFDSDSGCPRDDCRASLGGGEILWSQMGTFETLGGGVKVKETRAGDPKHRRCKGCAHLVSCCGLLTLSLICLPLIFAIGYVHVNVSSDFISTFTG
ncbi:unnamed protein product [Rodentolepis nana]|uniref:Protein tweety homolog n=1 Tax=Rodentolepis nana TaxID=102285 RepID=A0A0R3T4D8_RODNA|nr:unnamed protein product [Rodentolepis nana]